MHAVWLYSVQYSIPLLNTNAFMKLNIKIFIPWKPLMKEIPGCENYLRLYLAFALYLTCSQLSLLSRFMSKYKINMTMLVYTYQSIKSIVGILESIIVNSSKSQNVFKPHGFTILIIVFTYDGTLFPRLYCP